MTEQEAIKILNPDADVVWKAYDGKDLERCNEACRVACVALEKQIPKKPKKLTYKLLIDSGWEYECPNCGLAIGKNKYTNYEYLEEYEDYCQNCGQAIDWSDYI